MPKDRELDIIIYITVPGIMEQASEVTFIPVMLFVCHA